MSLNIKSFGRLIGFTSQNPTSTIGELDDKVATFSLTEKSYKSQTYPTAEVVTLSTKGTDGSEVMLNTELKDYLLKFTAFINDSVTSKLFNNSVQSAKTLIVSNTSQFGNEFIIKKVGAMAVSGSYYCPSYVEFDLVGDDLESSVIIWFTKASITQQYPLYTIYPISGISKLDDLHGADTSVSELLLTVNPTIMNALEQKQIGDYPNTAVASNNYKVYNDAGTILGIIYFSNVIYGPAGNNQDVIRETLVDFILSNSTYSRATWEKRIPDLFIKTEYIIVPRWDKTGIPNNGEVGALYLASVRPVESNTLLAKYASGIARSHIDKYSCINSTMYKSVMLVSIGSPTNRHGIYSLDTEWAHYATISTTSEDFSRYDDATKEFISRLQFMLMYAENINDYISLKENYTKVTRDDNVYVSTTLNNIQYLVLTKRSLLGQTD